jgi:hypothetical protein
VGLGFAGFIVLGAVLNRYFSAPPWFAALQRSPWALVLHGALLVFVVRQWIRQQRLNRQRGDEDTGV